MDSMIEVVGLVAAVVLPLWNIPLIVRIVRRRSAEDISLAWALGVWVCLLLMAPSGFRSADIVWRTFNIVNLALFSGVVVVTLKYNKSVKRLKVEK
jgi:uncharacterized protein with PQ loop repeat